MNDFIFLKNPLSILVVLLFLFPECSLESPYFLLVFEAFGFQIAGLFDESVFVLQYVVDKARFPIGE